jgi:hypothetical protein
VYVLQAEYKIRFCVGHNATETRYERQIAGSCIGTKQSVFSGNSYDVYSGGAMPEFRLGHRLGFP